MKKNKYGLLDPEFDEIVRTISFRDTVESALIFGSRAKGNYRSGSDVDIALKGRAVCHADVSRWGIR